MVSVASSRAAGVAALVHLVFLLARLPLPVAVAFLVVMDLVSSASSRAAAVAALVHPVFLPARLPLPVVVVVLVFFL